jgi:hypothetical protein
MSKSRSLHLATMAAGSLLAVGAPAAVLTASAAARHGTASHPAAAAAKGPTTVVVPADQTFTDTAIALVKGEKVTISATGTISPGAGTLANGPVGLTFNRSPEPGGDFNSSCGLDQYVLSPPPSPGVNCFALLFRIGSTGVAFPAGKTTSFTAPVSGELYLGINDGDVNDNSGNFTAKVTAKG